MFQWFYYLTDWLGTVRGVLDDNGATLNANDHYPFGLRLPGRAFVSSSAEGERYQFTGHEFDGETNYEYHGARYYNRELGRYMSVDPLAQQFFGWSSYNYTMDNPINMVDPTGMAAEGWIGKTAKNEDGSKKIDENGQSTTTWTWDSKITTREQALAAGADDFSDGITNNKRHTDSKYGEGTYTLNADGSSSFSFDNISLPVAGISWQKDYYDYYNSDNVSGIVKSPGYKVSNPSALRAEWGTSKSWQTVADAAHFVAVDFILLVATDGLMSSAGRSGTLYAELSANSSTINTGGRVFWSGGNVAKTAAANFANANGMKTLEMTISGRIMNSVSPYLPRAVSNPIWNNLSRSFAAGARGEANFFTTTTGPRATSIWMTVERPILQQNGVSIITHIR